MKTLPVVVQKACGRPTIENTRIKSQSIHQCTFERNQILHHSSSKNALQFNIPSATISISSINEVQPIWI